MPLSLDDAHPIVREAILQGGEDLRVEEVDGDHWEPLLKAYGVTDSAARDAILEIVNATGTAMAESEDRRFRRPANVACNILMTLLLGVRLARKGLV